MAEKFENLVEMFEKSVERYADNKLFGVKKKGSYEWLTYRQIGEQVEAVRGGLASLGVGAGNTVAIISNNRPQWAVGAYATYGLGARWVPMYEAQLEKDWHYIVNDSGARVLIVPDDTFYARVKSFVDDIDCLEHIVVLDGSRGTTWARLVDAGKRSPAPSVKPDSSDICGLIYTSGTTGNPKGVLLSHGNITSNINAVHSIFPMDESDVSLSFLPWAHSFGQTVELHCMLSYGAAMGLAESVQTIIQNIGEVRPTLLFSVPRIFNRIYDAVHKKMAAEGGVKKKLFDQTLKVAGARRSLAAEGRSSAWLDLQFKLLDKLVGQKIRDRFGGRLKYAFSGGAALSREVGEFIDNLNIKVYEGYGLTETSPIATANYPNNQKIGSIGKPIPEVTIKIQPIDIAPEGQGEIVVYGPNVMQGYHNLPEENDKVFTDDGGFRTGDMGRMDDDGYVFITGRVKEQYKLENGKYVVPSPLEEDLKLSGFIGNCLIDGTNRLYNIAVIVPDFEALKDWAAENGVGDVDPAALCANDAVRTLIEAEIQRYSTGWKGYERPKRFILTPDDFTVENGQMTPKMSLKRNNILEAYHDQIDALYAR